jgi:hypothetical protein
VTNSLDPHEAKLYRRRARLSGTLGLAAIPTAGAALVSHAAFGASQSAIAIVLSGPIDTMWILAYLFGGIFMAGGVFWRPFPRPEFEALGCWLMIGAMVTNGLAIIAVRGPVAGGLTSLGLFALADVLLARTRDLNSARLRHKAVRERAQAAYDGPERRKRPRH